jgi:hypothetical protein
VEGRLYEITVPVDAFFGDYSGLQKNFPVRLHSIARTSNPALSSPVFAW